MSEIMTWMSVDDVLGPAEARYFGHGFQRVSHQITQVAVRPDRIVGDITARATVTYPPDWSTKLAAQSIRPHLSTPDALIIGVQLAEAFLVHAHRLSPPARSRMWLRAFAMRAGANAQDDLTDFPACGRRTAMRWYDPASNQMASVFDFSLGTMRLSLEIDHDLGTRSLTPKLWPDTAIALGDPARRHYGLGFTRRRYAVTDVTVDPRYETAKATGRITNPGEHQLEGLSAEYEPTLSMVDATICAAQLAQVLCYHLEGVERSETDTLWMRRFEMHATAPWGPDLDAFTISARVLRRRRVDRMGSWRIYDLTGNIGGISATTTLAFNIPGAAARPKALDEVPA